MSLETGTRIADLVPTNPVGATDFVSQGDDHIRLIKACVQGSFPSLGATAVSLTGAQINDAALKGAANAFTGNNTHAGTETFNAAATFNALGTFGAGLTVSAGAVTLPNTSVADAALSSNVPLKNTAASISGIYTFTGTYTAWGSTGYIRTDIANTMAFQCGTSGYVWRNNGNSADLMTLSASGALVVDSGSVNLLTLKKSTVTCGYLTADGTGIGLFSGSNETGNGVYVTASSVTLQAGNALSLSVNTSRQVSIPAPSSGTALDVTGAANANSISLTVPNTTSQSFGLAIRAGTNSSDYPLYVASAAGVELFRVYGDGVVNAALALRLGGINVQSLPLINSTSTSLAKGQIHHITGNATLPALAAGEWCCVVNNSGSAITITKGGTTAYWTAAAASVSTVTLAARGRLVASGAGSSVDYISGDITGYT